MKRPRLLDLYSCAGGAGMGYHRAGFEVVGVDIAPQPRYPFEFHQGDAIAFLLEHGHEFDAIHASPPCQTFTAYGRSDTKGWRERYDDFLAPTRDALRAQRTPYVIENVVGAPMVDPFMLCGSSFGLNVRRHRLFETSFPILTPPCDHSWQKPRFKPSSTRTNLRSTVEVGVWRIPLAVQREAMGIDWMELRELSEAIPPAYTEFIGLQLLDHLEHADRAARRETQDSRT